MSDLISNLPYRRARRAIELAGDTAKPRRLYATEDLNVSERSVARMGLPTVYLGGIAHIMVGAAGKVLADRVHQRRKPKGRRGRGA
jgi:hypothetical protein